MSKLDRRTSFLCMLFLLVLAPALGTQYVVLVQSQDQSSMEGLTQKVDEEVMAEAQITESLVVHGVLRGVDRCAYGERSSGDGGAAEQCQNQHESMYQRAEACMNHAGVLQSA